MSALTNCCVAALRKGRIAIVVTMAVALAFPAVATHESEKSAEGCTITRSIPAVEVQYLAWHRQQTGRVELDSLTGFLRLFATIADELAAQGATDEIRRKP